MSFWLRAGPLRLSSRGRVGVRVGPVSWYGGGRRRGSGGAWAVIGLYFLVILVVGGLLIGSLWVGHYLLFDLFPTPHEFAHHTHGQLGRDYPLGWLRVLAYLVVLLGSVAAVLALLANPSAITGGIVATIAVLMVISAAVESGQSGPGQTSHDPAPVTPQSVGLTCTDGDVPAPAPDDHYRIECPNVAYGSDYNDLLTCPDGTLAEELNNSDPGYDYSCDGRIIFKGS